MASLSGLSAPSAMVTVTTVAQEISDMQPGSIKGLHLVVADMDVAIS
jgi:hypothetical protein